MSVFFTWFLTILSTSTAFAALTPPATTPTGPTAISTSYYHRVSFHRINASGGTCASAISYALHDFVGWAGKVTPRGRLVAPATLSPLSCACGLKGSDALVTCLASYEEEFSVTVTSDKTLAGFPHGSLLHESPVFASYGTGLECMEATEKARSKMYSTLESESQNYEFINLDSLVCRCEPGLDPVAKCSARVNAYFRDARFPQ